MYLLLANNLFEGLRFNRLHYRAALAPILFMKYGGTLSCFPWFSFKLSAEPCSASFLRLQRSETSALNWLSQHPPLCQSLAEDHVRRLGAHPRHAAPVCLSPARAIVARGGQRSADGRMPEADALRRYWPAPRNTLHR
jgi:hypothetical protein